MKYHLAVDIGASSGRCILGHRSDGAVVHEEVYRFENVPVRRGGALCWDAEGLFGHILAGMKHCAELGKIPVSVGVDTWGVDFVLLDGSGGALGEAVCYRDDRTVGMDRAAHEQISETEHYQRTGTGKQIYNTIYQLMAVKTRMPQLLERAQSLLFMPDNFHYRLSGIKASEYTIATTSGLINAAARDWDWEIIDRCGFPRRLFLPLSQPGTVLGGLTEAVKREVGFDCAVALPPSHDTASAFLAACREDRIILSSGTWSLMGVCVPEPLLSEEARLAGFTNEGAADGKFRFLKNIMGLWMIQSVRKELSDNPSYEQLSDFARESNYEGLIDVNDEAFFAPKSMIEAVADKCREGGYAPPQSIGDAVLCIYSSLAREYAKTVRELESLLERSFDGIAIIGGGNRNRLLNELTEQACQIPVHLGPTEGTATGNVLSQMEAGL